METHSFKVDRIRYLRVMRFFVGVLLHLIWWDILLRRIPGLGRLAARTSGDRWRHIARRFRRLAVHLGGVLIKLGQFLSIRVDVFPPEVIAELAGLQDEVPAEDLSQVQAVIAEEFGRPADAVFTWIAAEPDAAASLAQVHRARIVPKAVDEGEDAAGDVTEVVVKVQRTGMRTVVETDLAALRVAARWLRWYSPIRRRVDPDRLFEEFANTTRAELDFVAEGKNAERFAADFADDPGIVIPKIYWEYTTARVLTMENVAAIKITDRAAIESAGVSLPEVARRVYRSYLRQVFVTNFVHADPHPGNLFVRPTGGVPPDPVHCENPPVVQDAAGRSFQIVFVDFGMMAVVPERLRAQARDLLIGVATRDAHRMVQAYVDADVLLPGADRARLEEAHEDLLERLYGIKLGQLSHMAFTEAEFLWREYRDILFEMPFQIPSDLLLVMRSLGILAGIATSLNPNFDPWAETIPFAERLARQELGSDASRWLDEILQTLRMMWTLPPRLDRLLTHAERGQLATVVNFSPDAARMLQHVQRSIERLSWGVMFTSLLIAGVILRVNEGPSLLSSVLLAAAGVSLIWGITRQ